jgi:RNA polymerase sigma factor (sigma-70 family)
VQVGGSAVTSEDVKPHQAAAFRTTYLITGDASEAEDAAQEAFVKAYRALGRFQAGAPFRPWLLAVVANEAKNRRKAAVRRADLALRAGMENSRRNVPPSPEATILAAERRAELLHALGGLREGSPLQSSRRHSMSCGAWARRSQLTPSGEKT